MAIKGKIRVKTDRSEVEMAIKKAKRLRKLLKEANSLTYELASKEIMLKINVIRGGKGQMGEMVWRRLELKVSGEAEKERLERLVKEKNLSRQDMAVILFGLRVRPGFGKKDFGI